MKEPTPRTSRLALAGGALAVLAVAGAGFVVGRGSMAPAPAPSATPVVIASALPQPSPSPTSPQQLDRAGLLALVAAAADASSSAGPVHTAVTQAAGGRFSITSPFGCTGPLGDGDTAATGWRYDADSGALRLQVASTRWTPVDWFGDSGSAGIDAVEGFWIPRPWTSSETCPSTAGPAAAAGIEPVTLAGQSLAIGQVFREGAARQDQRNGDPYVAVVRVTPEALRAGSGFRVRVTGQLSDPGGGGAIRCRQPGGPDQRPICLVAATFDEIAIENAATGETLARWPGGSGRGA
jgi:hypothetical protein